jgi:steroid delta-isomerase-like uncharacterized protein
MRNVMTIEDSLALMRRHAAAWNAHDVQALLELLTDDCIYDAAAGSRPEGARHVGHAELEPAFRAIWAAFPDARWDDAEHFVDGEKGFSTWVFRGTRPDGIRVTVNGLDVLRFRDGLICHKDTYRKAVTA